MTNTNVPDYFTNAVAYKLPVTSSEYFLIENHQRLNYYEDSLRSINGGSTVTPSKGIIISHCGYSTLYSQSVDIESAFGRWNWRKNSGNYYIFPFERTTSQRLIELDKLDLRDMAIGPDTTQCDPECLGAKEDYFNIGYNQVFSPWSNPSSNTTFPSSNNFAVELISQEQSTGNIYCNLFVSQPITAAPSKPRDCTAYYNSENKPTLTWGANWEPTLVGYNVYKATLIAGTLPTYTCVASLGRTVRMWSDSATMIGNSDNKICYKISAVNSYGKESVLSDSVSVNYLSSNISTNTALKGCIVFDGNVVVNSGAKLSLDADATVSFPESPFKMEVFGSLELKSNLTIPLNATLRVASTSNDAGKLYIDSNKTLTVHGTFCTQGSSTQKVTIDRVGNTGFWTIAYDSSYNVPTASYTNSISWANIRHGYFIEILRSDATISDCTIDSCLSGIFMENSSPQIIGNDIRPVYSAIYGFGANTPFIYNNNIHSELGYSGYRNYIGIYLLSNMCPFVAKNRITGGYMGMYFSGNVVSYFTDTNCYPTNPNNKLTENAKGLWLNGAMCWGGDADFLGYNSIYENSKDVYCNNNSWLWAVGNYWGGSDLINYDCDSSSYIWAPLPLDTDPWDSEQLVKPQENTSIKTAALKKVNNKSIAPYWEQGLKMEKEGKIDEAISHYKNMVVSDIACGSALTKIALLSRKNKKGDIKPYLSDLLNSKINKRDEAGNLLANLTLQDGDYTGAMKLYDKVIAEYPKNITASFARVEKLFATLHIEKNKEKAASLLSELQSMDITDPGLLSLLQSANLSIYGEGSSYEQRNRALSKANTLSSLPKEYSLSNNYPNPFNPATSISYELPKDRYVSLVVYDVLGKVVKSLVDEQKQAGRYTATFNAANLPSGIYFYTLKAGSFTSTKKMLLIK